MKTRLFFSIALTMIATLPSALAQKKTIQVIPETATIFCNGKDVGHGSYSVTFGKKDDFVMLKFEASGYVSKTVKLLKTNPQKSITYELTQDEAEVNSVGVAEGVDLANKFFTVTVRKDMTEEVAWRRLMNITVTHFENVEIRDQAAGWIRTAWIRTVFKHQYVRTRMEIQQQFMGENELAYRVKISSEIADVECGFDDQCFVKYDRILKQYQQIISELQASLGSNY